MSKYPVLNPSIEVLCKVGSVVAHVEEAIGDDGHPFDVIALRQLLVDPDVQGWLADMRVHAFIPEPRKAKP